MSTISPSRGPARPPGRLDGRVAIVTGGGSGIGRAVVDRYVAEGARVAVLERDPERAAQLASGHDPSRVRVVVGDVRCEADHERVAEVAVESFGRVDIYVGNAGLYDYSAPFDTLDPARLVSGFTELFETNVLGYLLGVRAVLPHLRAARGSVILTASSSGSYAGGGGVLYVASKHAVVGVVRQLAHELAPDVRVNAVAPGATRTALAGVGALGQSDRRLDRSRSFEQTAARHIPLGFVSAPEQHTGLYVLLADPGESGFVTGAVLPSDGGLEVRGPRPSTATPDERRPERGASGGPAAESAQGGASDDTPTAATQG
ncbi:3-(cis-5,6-dihydroxycyclohexa-1,3-dien-1-yl)propanoate dehydrogenase [Embleya sp. AB8]|uniref:3-(cis-5,6-dihydroxycyclohexa-1, 3-dien-1-yl)propanoate dehydrogenase n=1 Tax=Embleya sp. AB8 TaxID=3156304 RepID=UPI003C74F634